MPETDVVAPEDLNKAERSLWDALPGGSPRLGLACRVPPSGQLVSRREEALLQVCVSMLPRARLTRSEEHTSELQSRPHLVCRLLLEKKKTTYAPLLLKKKKTNIKN